MESNVCLRDQGLGKGGAKRHRKILRDNIQGMFVAVDHWSPYLEFVHDQVSPSPLSGVLLVVEV